MGKRSGTYAMLPELFDHSQAEDIGYLRVHRETGGQDVSILTPTQTERHYICYIMFANLMSLSMLIMYPLSIQSSSLQGQITHKEGKFQTCKYSSKEKYFLQQALQSLSDKLLKTTA